ncbi:MAG: hypothetical protein C4B59_16495 [Candidatus Methanogaster sp.]|uniref:Uncharacterized protein n=1 Tax=Candidatus Methanogaster sp. TaxID=3386292 RepID=A0AC61KYB3_9EURY|nr:MAG: hypothetical protein C4B59_16495 [ANME-2 cluster archaeon]
MCITAESLGSVELEDFMRQKLPDLLRERGEFRYEIMGILADVFASKDDLKQVLEEIRKLREDSNRRFGEMDQRFEEVNRTMNQRFEEVNRMMNQRFEEVNRRFEEMDTRFEVMYRSQREVRLEVSALGGRIGYGLEEIIRQTVEEFSGQSFKKFEHLRLRDSEGELYGIPADVEYDLYLEDSVNYVVEVKSHIKPGDVLIFHRKSLFAEKQLLKRIKPIMISASITKDAKKKCKELGIDLISRSVVD